MEIREKTRPHRQILWGVLLMALGGVFLLDRLGIVDLPSMWSFWPLVLLVLGVSRLLTRQPGAAATFILMGLAFFSAEFHWLGLSYSSFWPLLLVAVGVGIVIKAVSAEEACPDREEACCDREEKAHD
jgi:hypothetical protein